MVAKRQFEVSGGGRAFIFICAVSFVLYGSLGFAGEQADTSKVARYMVFSLQHISAEQGKKFLAKIGIGTISQLPSANTLLVTAQPAQLTKAAAIVQLVDSDKDYVIRAIYPASEAPNLPDKDKIAAEIGTDISIGTFSNPPRRDAAVKAIIDINNGAVIAVAPADELEEIISAIGRLQEAQLHIADANSQLPSEEQITKQQPPEANKPNDLFDNLLDTLDTLAGTEKETADTVGVEPAEQPEAVSFTPSAKDTVKKPNERPKEPSLAAILERLNTLEAKARAKPQPGPEESAADTEQADETAEADITLQSYEPKPIARGNEMLELDLPEKLEIADLLRLVGEYLNLDYMYDPAEVKGSVTLKLRGPIKVKDLYPLLESVLKFKGLAMTRKGNLVTIVPGSKVLDIDPTLMDDQKSGLEFGDVIVTRIFKLSHIETASAKNLLAEMKLGVNVREIPETRTLIVTGYAYRMVRIEELLAMVDKPGEPRIFRFRQLKYTMAKTLAPMIKTLSEQIGTVSVSIAAPAGPAPLTRRRGESSAAFRARQAREAKARAKKTAKPSPPEPAVYLDADERTNRILMIGFEEQLAVIDELIDTLDVEQRDLRSLRLYEIQHVGAEEVVQKLNELGIISGQTTRQRTSARPTRATKPGKSAKQTTPADSEVKEAPVEEPQVVIIEATNSLLVNATDEQHMQIATIIGYVDTEAEEASIPYVVYPLENQEPKELADTLNQLIQETITEKGKGDKIIKTTQKKIEEDITIIPDEATFSLIVYASKKNQQWVESLIKQLDKRRPQVLLDVTLVQITKDDAFSFDLDMLSGIPNLQYTSGQIPDLSSSIADLLLAPESNRNKFIEMKSKAGAFTGFYGDEKINALLTAMQTKKYGRVMARPKLLVNDNEEGEIKTTDTTYIERKETAWVGTEEPVSTEKVIFEDYSAGITLKIKPHISTGDMLRLEITLNRSGFTEALEGLEKPPNKSDADVTTVVTVPDRSTIILGGMEKIGHSKGGKKIPILGDLPIIGGAFREVTKAGSHDKLYIFVKAHILRPGGELALADLKDVSRENRQTFEKLESEMQTYEIWPGIEPEPMDPLKILEAD